MFFTVSDKYSPQKRVQPYLLTTQGAAPTAICKIPNNVKPKVLDTVALTSL